VPDRKVLRFLLPAPVRSRTSDNPPTSAAFSAWRRLPLPPHVCIRPPRAPPRNSFARSIYLEENSLKPAIIRFGSDVADLLRRRPQSGPLFPYLRSVRAGDRATEFKQRCDGLKIYGVSLHSYRYAWAERALKCGYPERFAQEALGHNSKAVHHAYARNADVIVPSLEDWETHWTKSQQPSEQPKLTAAELPTPLQQCATSP
jgi:hypothetical protein